MFCKIVVVLACMMPLICSCSTSSSSTGVGQLGGASDDVITLFSFEGKTVKQEQMKRSDFLAYKGIVPNISVFPFTNEYIEETDSGFTKSILVFDTLKQVRTYTCELSRPFPKDSKQANQFALMGSYNKDNPSLRKGFSVIKTHLGSVPDFIKDYSATMIISEKGFLPGEKVTVRLSQPGIPESKTLSFFPRPIVLMDKRGKKLMEAELTSLRPTTYILYVSFDRANPLVRFYSVSGVEVVDVPMSQDQRLDITYNPGVISRKGGKSALKLTYKNGDTYDLQFPWGTEFLQYYSDDH